MWFHRISVIIISELEARAVTRRCSIKQMFLKISQNSQETACARLSFLIKLQAQACNFIKKEALAQVMFSYENCKIFKNIYFIEHLRTTASEGSYFLRKIPTVSDDFKRSKVNQFFKIRLYQKQNLKTIFKLGKIKLIKTNASSV